MTTEASSEQGGAMLENISAGLYRNYHFLQQQQQQLQQLQQHYQIQQHLQTIHPRRASVHTGSSLADHSAAEAADQRLAQMHGVFHYGTRPLQPHTNLAPSALIRNRQYGGMVSMGAADLPTELSNHHRALASNDMHRQQLETMAQMQILAATNRERTVPVALIDSPER